MSKEEGEFRDFTDGSSDKKVYKNKVVFLHKSQKGKHLYAFDYKGAFLAASEGSIIMNISDVEALLEDRFDSIKVSIMPKQEKEDAAESG